MKEFIQIRRDRLTFAMMIGILLPKAKPASPDEADALAIAICHAQHRGARELAARVAAR